MNDEAQSRFGETLAFADFNGDGLKDLVMGTPRLNSNMTGGVTILFS
jgi:hypothetical protein